MVYTIVKGGSGFGQDDPDSLDRIGYAAPNPQGSVDFSCGLDPEDVGPALRR